MKELLIYLLIPIIWLVIMGWSTGSAEHIFNPKDDERKQYIKQKAIVQSWGAILLFLMTNLVLDFFQLTDPRLKNIPNIYPEIPYILVGILSYFVFYFINSRKLSAE